MISVYIMAFVYKQDRTTLITPSLKVIEIINLCGLIMRCCITNAFQMFVPDMIGSFCLKFQEKYLCGSVVQTQN